MIPILLFSILLAMWSLFIVRSAVEVFASARRSSSRPGAGDHGRVPAGRGAVGCAAPGPFSKTRNAKRETRRGKGLFALAARRWNARVNTALDAVTEALVFWFFAAISTIGRWWECRRVCAWCHARLGGNPFAQQVTHGICCYCAYELTHENPATARRWNIGGRKPDETPSPTVSHPWLNRV